jgi:hypothetical protein
MSVPSFAAQPRRDNRDDRDDRDGDGESGAVIFWQHAGGHYSSAARPGNSSSRDVLALTLNVAIFIRRF